MIRKLVIPALAAPALALVAPAAEAEETSYSHFDESCTSYQYEAEPVWEISCRGDAGWSVFLMASDHGSSISYAFDGSERSEFHSPPSRGLFGRYGDVIEWRSEADVPFATIHRYIHDTPTPSGSPGPEFHTLIVTALRPGERGIACPVAYIDASVLSGANEIAQAVADRVARRWTCGDEPVLFDGNNPDVAAWTSDHGY